MIYLSITVIVLICVLAGGVVFYRLRRRSALSRLLFSLLTSGATLLGIGLFSIGAFYALWREPWPISLRQGPDTNCARICFERVVGEELPPTFFGVCCREDWGPFGDSTYSIRFSFDHCSQVESFVQLNDLRRGDDTDRSGFDYYSGPAWWPTEVDLFALPEAYVYQGYEKERMWVDPVAQIAYFQRASW